MQVCRENGMWWIVQGSFFIRGGTYGTWWHGTCRYPTDEDGDDTKPDYTPVEHPLESSLSTYYTQVVLELLSSEYKPDKDERTLTPHQRPHHPNPLLHIGLTGNPRVLRWSRPWGRLLLPAHGRGWHPHQHHRCQQINLMETPFGCPRYKLGRRRRISAHGSRWESHLMYIP